MNALLLSAGVLLATLSPARMEKEALAHVSREYERANRPAPWDDTTLVAAARALAVHALDTGAGDAADVQTITAFVSEAGGHDPTPRAVVIRASPPEHALETFLKRTDLAQEPATHVGVGAVIRGDRGVLVALLAERKSTLEPFPRALPRPGRRTLCGELLAPLRRAEIYVTRPGGRVDRVRPSRETGTSFCAPLDFLEEGRYSAEVIGHGPRGPEVAAIFYVDAGRPRPGTTRLKAEEPRNAEDARIAVLARINALREAQGVPQLALDERLSRVAQDYSDRMAREGFFAHVAPDGSDLRARLTRAGYAYERAGENLGLAEGPLAAHFGIEHSPGHRRNLIDPDFTRVGIGITFHRKGDKPQVILTELFSRPRLAHAPTLQDAYRTLSAKRAALRLPPLERSEVLEQIAISHARRALALDTPKSKLPGSNVHDRVFAAMADVKTASVDFIVADTPTTFPDSRGLSDARNNRVGIGAVKGDSPTHGKGKYWVVVIYTASR